MWNHWLQFLCHSTFMRKFQWLILNWGWWRIMTELHVNVKNHSTLVYVNVKKSSSKSSLVWSEGFLRSLLVTTLISALLTVLSLFTVLSLPKKFKKFSSRREKKWTTWLVEMWKNKNLREVKFHVKIIRSWVIHRTRKTSDSCFKENCLGFSIMFRHCHLVFRGFLKKSSE